MFVIFLYVIVIIHLLFSVLEGQHLSQYAEFDVKSQEASGFKV